jgi:hypothetical protein
MTPGKLRVLVDRPNQTRPVYLTAESYTEKGITTTYDTPYVLFTPHGAQAQYAICSPIVDEYGTLYFKNDSAHMMAIGSAITGIEVTTPPEKTQYGEGEMFDPAGMTVTATYQNGKTRDITEYVSFSTGPLTVDDTRFIIRFEHVMYQNSGGEAGVRFPAPYAVVRLVVNPAGPQMKGDMDGNGALDALDAMLVAQLALGGGELTDRQLAVADFNGDGVVDALDAMMIAQAALSH